MDKLAQNGKAQNGKAQNGKERSAQGNQYTSDWDGASGFGLECPVTALEQ